MLNSSIPSAHRFFNSLFREWSSVKRVQAPTSIALKHDIQECFQIELSQQVSVYIPLERYSPTGRHRYAKNFYLKNASQISEIPFGELSELLIDYLSVHYDADAASTEAFKSRLRQSQEVIDLILESRRHAPHKSTDPRFLETEQSLYFGHSFHPTPKSREPLTEAEMKEFSPEFGGSFPLHWWCVKRERIQARSADQNSGAFDWIRRLCQSELGLTTAVPEGFEPYPVHPWQRKVLLESTLIQSWIEDGSIIEKGPSQGRWSPTSSMRSLYREGSEYMLKFSLSLRLTNSVRHLLPREVTRGIQLKNVLATEPGLEFQKRYPDFHVIYEPAYLVLLSDDGIPLPETIVVARDNPFMKVSDQNKVVLATLNEEDPEGRESMLASLIQKRMVLTKKNKREAVTEWFQVFLDQVFAPFMMAQAQYGILLGAHQQNIILDLKDGLPTGLYFRDCQGTGYSVLGTELYKNAVPGFLDSVGNLLDETVGNHLFTYYAVINSTFGTIAALADAGGVDERDLLKLLREKLIALRSTGPRDLSCLNYLIDSETLMQKGNFLCSISGMNENTTTNPHAIYNAMENPIRAK